jgi:plastocyanin
MSPGPGITARDTAVAGARPTTRIRAPRAAATLSLLAAPALVAALVLSVAPPSGAGTAAGGASRVATVRVGDVFFSPTRLSVRRGTRVRWVWRGQLRHNVTVVRGPLRFARAPSGPAASLARCAAAAGIA